MYFSLSRHHLSVRKLQTSAKILKPSQIIRINYYEFLGQCGGSHMYVYLTWNAPPPHIAFLVSSPVVSVLVFKVIHIVHVLANISIVHMIQPLHSSPCHLQPKLKILNSSPVSIVQKLTTVFIVLIFIVNFILLTNVLIFFKVHNSSYCFPSL